MKGPLLTSIPEEEENVLRVEFEVALILPAVRLEAVPEMFVPVNVGVVLTDHVPELIEGMPVDEAVDMPVPP